MTCCIFVFQKGACGGDIVTYFKMSFPGRFFIFLFNTWKIINNVFQNKKSVGRIVVATPGMGMGGGNNMFINPISNSFKWPITLFLFYSEISTSAVDLNKKKNN